MISQAKWGTLPLAFLTNQLVPLHVWSDPHSPQTEGHVSPSTPSTEEPPAVATASGSAQGVEQVVTPWDVQGAVVEGVQVRSSKTCIVGARHAVDLPRCMPTWLTAAIADGTDNSFCFPS